MMAAGVDGHTSTGVLIFLWLLILYGQSQTMETQQKFYSPLLNFPANWSTQLSLVTTHIGSVTTALNVTVATATATGPGYDMLTKTITDGNVAVFPLSQKTAKFIPGIVQQLGVTIESSSIVSAFTTFPCLSPPCDQVIYPINVLGNEYIVLTPPYRDSMTNQLHVIATASKTLVTFLLPTMNGFQVKLDNRTYVGGDKIEVNMDERGTYAIQSNHDLSGLRISANKAVSVSLGIVNRDTSYEYMSAYSPLPATETWGTTHILLLNSHRKGVIRIIGKSTKTQLVVSDGFRSNMYTLEKWTPLDLNVSDSDCVWLESDLPVLPMLFQSQATSLDPHVMSPVPAVHHTHSVYAFEATDSSVPISIIIAQGQDGHILLNGQTLHTYFNRPIQWLSIQTKAGTFLATRIHVPPGVYRLSHQHPAAGFIVYLPSVPLALPMLNPSSSEDLQTPPTTGNLHLAADNAPAATDIHQTRMDDGFKVETEQPAAAPNMRHASFAKLDDGFKVETEKAGSEAKVINFHEAGAIPRDEIGGLSAGVIAVIVSLASAIFFVIVCISGFVIAETICKTERFSRSKVAPIFN